MVRRPDAFSWAVSKASKVIQKYPQVQVFDSPGEKEIMGSDLFLTKYSGSSTLRAESAMQCASHELDSRC